MSKVEKFRKRPVVIGAMQFDGTWTSALDVMRWALGQPGSTYFVGEGYEHDLRRESEFDGSTGSVLSVAPAFLVIPTLEGDHRADRGDWIIRGVQGEFYPCKPDIFEATYEAVES